MATFELCECRAMAMGMAMAIIPPPMAYLDLLPANPFPSCRSTLALPRLSASFHFPVPSSSSFPCRPARLPSSQTSAMTALERLIVRCFADNRVSLDSSAVDLKSQLEALQTEAEQARARANAARARFMRLTETVENLRMRAALDVKAGREESARQLIAEKQKVMKALEKSKQRAELLEQLSIKLNEAISRKETQLIASLSSARLNVDDQGKYMTNIRIISPKEEAMQAVKADDEKSTGISKQNANNFQQVIQDAPGISVTSGTSAVNGLSNDPALNNEDMSNKADAMLSTSPDLYANFLASIDDRLNNVEIELHDFMNVAAMILPDTGGVGTNEKVATVKQIWHDIRNARARIRRIALED